jgi:hypothetical protein
MIYWLFKIRNSIRYKVFSLPEKGPITEFMAPAMAPFLFFVRVWNTKTRTGEQPGFGRTVMNDVVAL